MLYVVMWVYLCCDVGVCCMLGVCVLYVVLCGGSGLRIVTDVADCAVQGDG